MIVIVAKDAATAAVEFAVLVGCSLAGARESSGFGVVYPKNRRELVLI